MISDGSTGDREAREKQIEYFEEVINASNLIIGERLYKNKNKRILQIQYIKLFSIVNQLFCT